MAFENSWNRWADTNTLGKNIPLPTTKPNTLSAELMDSAWPGAQAMAEDIWEGAQGSQWTSSHQLVGTAGLMPVSRPTGGQDVPQVQPACHELVALWGLTACPAQGLHTLWCASQETGWKKLVNVPGECSPIQLSDHIDSPLSLLSPHATGWVDTKDSCSG